MQVSDAMIGLEGQVYGRGRLSVLGMDQVTAEATTIEVAGNESSAQFFTAAPSDRDQRSGYLTSDRQGATVRKRLQGQCDGGAPLHSAGRSKDDQADE